MVKESFDKTSLPEEAREAILTLMDSYKEGYTQIQKIVEENYTKIEKSIES
jgi:hypothetical protein